MDENKIDELFMEYELGLDKALEHLKSELLQIRAGRANPHILDRVMVNYYGTPTPLNQIANISVQDARMLVINCWDQNAVREAVKGINAADTGINPSDDGKIIRMVFPTLIEERRRDLVKDVRKNGEECKIACRNERRDIMDKLKTMKKDGEISEDDYNSYEKDVQKNLDDYSSKIDKEVENKEKEIMQI